MKLQDLLYGTGITSTYGDMEVVVPAIEFDSRKISKGALFVAVKGTATDGHDYIVNALDAGASVIVSERQQTDFKEGVTYVTVKDTARALGIISSNFYGVPSKKLKLVGVTGTNGKTTTVTLLYKLFQNLGYHTGMLSTVRNMIHDRELDATHTTPDAITINRLLAQMVKEGITHCFMEVSSHSIDQHRVTGLHFTGGIFTNISHDHLDYHGTFEKYIEVKKRLFDGLGQEAFALTNVDDRRGKIMLQNTKAAKYSFGFKNIADYKGKLISNTLQGLELDVNGTVVWFRLIGGFNSYNLLAVYSAAVLLGEETAEVLTALSELEGVDGRFERVPAVADMIGIIDYAHTPDALENVLDTIENLRTGNEQVITVVGCGGDRDREKRPVMASIACRFSDKVIITSDNPRSEDPEKIIQEMTGKLDPLEIKKVLKISDREEAIKTACMLAENSDIILVAGKGHEKYQEIKGVKHPFDDKEVLMRMLKMKSN